MRPSYSRTTLRYACQALLWMTLLALTRCGPGPSQFDNPGDFKINLRFVSNISDSQKAAFEQAAARWSQVITVGLPGLRLRFPANDCGEGLPAFDGTIDSLLIDVQVKPIDGPGRILGGSGPCKIRNSSNLPGYGIMTLDATDLNTLETSGQLQATITHEMGHVLGYGTLWDDFKLTTGTGNGASCGSDSQYVGALWCVSGTPSAGAETSRSRPPAVWGPVIAAGESRCLATS